MIDDVEAVEAAEASLDAFINKRSRAKEKVNAEEEAWKASTKLVNEKARRRRKMEWINYYGHMNRVHLSLAASHAARRARLLAEGGYEPLDQTDETQCNHEIEEKTA